jgi:ABC-2 type transport system ATP-binding protein
MSYFGRLQGFSRKEARSRSLKWLAKVGLPQVGDWRVERLSKGMSQKVQIASALLVDPDLCVLDEPFAGLDPVNLRLIQELILERKAHGKTTILSTHQMSQVETLCDRVGLIHQGELMVYGGVDEVRRRFSLPEVRIDIEGELPSLDGVKQAFPENGTVWRLLLSPEVRADNILKQLVQLRVPVNRFEKVLAPLEDIFVRVVQEGER